MMKVQLAACAIAVGLAGFSMGAALAAELSDETDTHHHLACRRRQRFSRALIARAITAPLGPQVIVDNRATVIIADLVAKSPPDGHTLLVTGSAHWIGPLIEKVTYDAFRDFAPITLIDRSPSVLVVHPSMPAKTVKQFIALAKAKAGAMNFSMGAPGTSNHLGALLFNHQAGTNIVLIPYKGTGPALAAVVTGEVHAMFGSAGGAAPHMASGRLRALAVGSAKPSPLAPGVPTMDASGLPGFLSEALHALYAPAGTPPAVVARLNQEVGKYLQSPEARDIFMKAGIETAPGTPDELTAITKSEVARVSKVLKVTGKGT